MELLKVLSVSAKSILSSLWQITHTLEIKLKKREHKHEINTKINFLVGNN